MTSPNDPPKESLRDRISTRLSTDDRGRHIDADAQHTRNVSWMFYGLIVVAVVILVGGLAYGFWESNLKPMANVDGTEVSRGTFEDRKALEDFRADRADSQTSTALAAGTIDSNLANTRFNLTQSERPVNDAAVVTELVDLIFTSQLAAEEGVELTEAELQTALAAEGTFPESRSIEALFVLTPEQEAGSASTDAGIADAYERALAIVEELEAGADPEALAETYGPANYDSAYINDGADIGSLAWMTEIFAAEEGGVTPPVEASTGEQLVALVTTIVPEQPDPGFIEAVNDEVGEEAHRRNVELETLEVKLEQHVTDQALAAQYDQVELAQIFIERSASSADDTAGEAHVSHILYVPDTPLDEEDNPTDLADLPDDDPAWDAAEAEAQAAADELAAIEDADERTTAFVERAITESDGPSGPRGGDLDWFPREAMVTEFADAIWSGTAWEHGDIIGPVRSDFGWHVILFDAFRSSLDVRVAHAEETLAADGAEFAMVAAELSDGPGAAGGGNTGWQVADQLDPELALTLAITEIGDTTEPFDEGDGYRIYQKLDEDTRPLEPGDAAIVAETAYLDWYDDLYFAAEDEGRITIDSAVFDAGIAPPPVRLPTGGHGG